MHWNTCRLSERCLRAETKWHIGCSSLTHRYSACGPMSTPGWTISELVDDFKGCLFILFFVFCLDSHVTSSESGSHPHARRVCLLMIHTLAPWLRGAKAKTQVCTRFYKLTSRGNSVFLQSSKTNGIIQVYFISQDIFVITALFLLLMRNTLH